MSHQHGKLSQLVALTAAAIVLSAAADLARAAEVTITKCDGKAVVKIDGDPFTEYVFEGHTKPILYPVIGPTGIGMTRNYPMKEDVDNEALDHPHQKSLWFTHDDVNGVHFWLEYPGKGSDLKPGRIVQKKIEIEADRIRTEDDWLAPDGNPVCSDTRLLAFGVTPAGRYIDFAITLRASHGDVVFGDTKEGAMGIRTHPLLRLQADEKRGNHTAKGNCVDSEGIEGKAIWGQAPSGLTTRAPIEGKPCGIAILDHPVNPRHPTSVARPILRTGRREPVRHPPLREGEAGGAGDMKIASGDSVTFRYRFLFHRGDVREANVAGEYEAFAKAD